MLRPFPRRARFARSGTALALTTALGIAAVAAGVGLLAAGSEVPAGARPFLPSLPALRAAWPGGSGATLDVYGTMPAFALVDQLERPVNSEDVRGRVVLADFVYTTCTDSCPLLSSRMQAVQERLRAERLLGTRVALLSFSVDPARDTPAALRAYAERYRADPDAWRFLTGPEKYVLPLVTQGFRLAVQQIPLRGAAGGQEDAAGRYDTMHSNRFVLIDGQSQIRAYYDGLALDGEQVLRDVRQLLR